MNFARTTIFVSLAITVAASGSPIDVRVIVAGTAVPPQVTLIHAVRATSAHPQERLVQAEKGAAALELPAGVWYLTPRSPGYFGETRTIVMPAGGEPVGLRLWPAATLFGQLPRQSSVKHVTVRFQPATDGSGQTSLTPPAGMSDCTIERRRVECTVPAGRLDYSLRSSGYIPRYKWNQELSPSQAVDVGQLDFRSGASLIGQVVMPRHVRPRRNPRVLVVLAPDTGAPRPDDEAHAPMREATVTADDRGRFVFEGVAPGAYHLSAAAPGLVSLSKTVTILDGLEAELREPIVLTAPLSLVVRVNPPVDPWGGVWRIELQRPDHDDRHATVVHSAPANPKGVWTRDVLTPGDYVVKVQRLQGVWHSGAISLTESTDMTIDIPLVRVDGELLLGEDRIPGSMWFGGEFGEISVPVRTTAEGTFQAVLPAVQDNVWSEVEVASERPPVRASLRNIKLAGPHANGIATVRIALPNHRVYGEVTDSTGAPVSTAMVFADPLARGRPLQIEVDESGTFAFNGLTAGAYSIQAIGPAGKSRSRTITIEDASDQYVPLVLMADAEISGTVVSRHAPLVGARVSIYPENRTVFGILPRDRTDFEGRFSVSVQQPQNMSMTVAAPGFAYKLFELARIPEEPLTISVESNGGSLVVEVDANDLSKYFLFHGRAFVSLASLHAEGVATRIEQRITVDRIESGQYDVCVATAAEAIVLARTGRSRPRCSSGLVAPGGTVTLAMSE